MARPPRRRPALPDHDPRAIRAKLRRELYEYAATRRELDRIEFRVVDSGGPPPWGIVPYVNGTSLEQDLDVSPLPWSSQLVPPLSLRELEGQRRVLFAGPDRCDVACCGGEGGIISVRGRYVMWELDSPLFREPLLFDRASYRESLEAAYAEVLAVQSPQWQAVWSIAERLDITAAPVPGLGLVDVQLTGEPGRRALSIDLRDPLWHAVVRLAPRWDEGDIASNVPRILSEVARWDEQALDVSWCASRGGGVQHPPYPERWRRADA